jgi:hypothetical protein
MEGYLMAGNSSNGAYRIFRSIFVVVLFQSTCLYPITWPWQDPIDAEIRKIRQEAKEEKTKAASGAFKQAVTAGSVAALGGMLTDLEQAKQELERVRERNRRTIGSRWSTAGLNLVKRNYSAWLFPRVRLGGPLALTLGSLGWIASKPVQYWREKQRIDKGMGEKIHTVKEAAPFTYIEKR